MKRTCLFVAVFLVVLLTGFAVRAEEPPQMPLFPDGVVFTPLGGGNTTQIESFRGRPVLLTFWASWCGPCRVELPELAQLYSELMGSGFVLLTVNVDRNPMAGQRFFDSLGLALPVYRLDPNTLRILGIDSLPVNILLDGDGRLVQAYKGYTTQMVEDIRRLVLEMTEPEQP